jgi:hypothetical protein
MADRAGVLGCPGPEYGLLLEREAGLALRAVLELHHELAARARPGLAGLPHVGVPASAFGVGESAGSGGYRLLDAVQWGAGVGGDLPRPRRVSREDVETVVAAQREPHRDASCLDDLKVGGLCTGLKKPLKV